jgi:ubiquinone/menaquinone biosynthesis C-methylase UbiE
MRLKGLFDRIAPIYGLFYNYQRRYYKRALNGALSEVNLATYESIVDVGCGTGALCSVLSQMGHKVTGMDPAEKMLGIASKHPENKEVDFIQSSILQRTPFEDKSFDVSVTSYVAHGLKEADRKLMYSEMNRITKNLIIIYDYNQKRSIWVDIIELLEGGDYFNFIENVNTELKERFSKVSVIQVSKMAACYICYPNDLK